MRNNERLEGPREPRLRRSLQLSAVDEQRRQQWI
jgi:hypothetical protein